MRIKVSYKKLKDGMIEAELKCSREDDIFPTAEIFMYDSNTSSYHINFSSHEEFTNTDCYYIVGESYIIREEVEKIVELIRARLYVWREIPVPKDGQYTV